MSGGLVIPAKIKPLLIPSVAGKAGYKPGTSLPKGEAVYSRAAIRGMNRAMMEGAAELAHAPKSLYGKMTDAELVELLHGNHWYWDMPDPDAL